MNVVGGIHAVRRRRPARFAGVRLPGSPRVHALTIGSPLSAPPVLLLVLLLATRRHRTDLVAVLSGLFLLGVVGEADTFAAAKHPMSDRLATVCALLEVAIPVAMLRSVMP